LSAASGGQEGVTVMEPIFTIKTDKKEDKYARLVITPLESGFGDTLGTALRRVLLSSMRGSAVIGVKIKDVNHQFSTLKGMKEDVLDLLLNIKKIRFSYAGDTPIKVTLSAKGVGEVKAGDIKTSSGIEVANPELVLANLSDGAKLDVEFMVESGVGYKLADEHEDLEVGMIALDSSYSPIQRVNYKIEETRVGQVTNYSKLNLEIWTDGTVEPEDAIVESSKTLIAYLNQIVNPKELEVEETQEEEDTLGPVGKLSVEEIGLPTRVANALSRSGYDTVERLVKAERDDLVKVRNLGEKSIDVINDALKEKGVQLENA